MSSEHFYNNVADFVLHFGFGENYMVYMFVEIIFEKPVIRKTTGSLMELPAAVDHAGLKVGCVV